MAQPLFEIVDQLPAGGLTVAMLRALDWVVPDTYDNLTGFDDTIRAVTGETDEAFVQAVGERAIHLYNDRSEGYQRALWIYQAADATQGYAGTAAFLSKLGQSVGFLGFLERMTPKADTTQAIDLALKLTAEVAAFCTLNGLPGDSTGDFVRSLSDARHARRMRLAAMVCVDGVLPLGPDFVRKAADVLDGVGGSMLRDNERFKRLRGVIPGDSTAEQLTFVRDGLLAIGDWADAFVARHELTADRIASSLKGASDRWDGRLDLVAATLDMTTNYVEHTGVQSVARAVISRAAAEV